MFKEFGSNKNTCIFPNGCVATEFRLKNERIGEKIDLLLEQISCLDDKDVEEINVKMARNLDGEYNQNTIHYRSIVCDNCPYK